MTYFAVIRPFRIAFGICRGIVAIFVRVIIVQLTRFIPLLKTLALKKSKVLLAESKVTPEHVLQSLNSRHMIKTGWTKFMNDAFKTAWCGYPAPNGSVLTQDGATRLNLLDAMKPGRPLVINFGSCT